MAKAELLGEVWTFMKKRKVYWIGPLVIILVLFGLLLFLTETSVVAPFIYTLF